MFRFFPVIISIGIMLSSCGVQPQTVAIGNRPFSYKVGINYRGKNYKYNLSGDGVNAFQFAPTDNTAPIIFSLINDKCFIKNNGVQFELSTDAVKPIPIAVVKAVKTSIGEVISPDYNGAYKHYGTIDNGEYCLTVDEKANIKSVIIKSIGLKAEFS